MKLKYVENSDGFYISDEGNLYCYNNSQYEFVCPILTGEYPYWDICFQGTWRKVSCHLLVAQYFVPNPDNLLIVHHKDNNKFNYRPDNLQWITQRENVIKAIQDGLTHATPLKTVRYICSLILLGKSNKEIEDITKIPNSTISAIRHKRRWKHISDNYF